MISQSARNGPYQAWRRDEPIDDVEPVEVLERDEELGGVEPTPLLVELALALKMVEELSTINESEDEVELLLRLERELERDNERVVDLGEDGSLGKGVGDLGARDNVRLANCFERVDTRGVALADLHDLRGKSQRTFYERKNRSRDRPCRRSPCR